MVHSQLSSSSSAPKGFSRNWEINVLIHEGKQTQTSPFPQTELIEASSAKVTSVAGIER